MAERTNIDNNDNVKELRTDMDNSAGHSNSERDIHRSKDKGASAGKMTVEEAGRKGGERTAQTRGSEFYQMIGRKGGEAVSRDRQHMAAIGRKGGEAVSRDRAHMAAIGQKGGEARGLHHQRRMAQQRETRPSDTSLSSEHTHRETHHDRAG